MFRRSTETSRAPRRRRRQLGSDRRSALPILPAPASDATLLIGQIAIVVTVVGWALFVVVMLTRSSLGGGDQSPPLDLATIVYLVIMSLLACSALAYLTTRLGYYTRTRTHRRVPRAALTQHLDHAPPTMTVLVPSYQEDERVIRMTLLSAALQEYPDLDIVLLIDDPPEPKYAEPAALLDAAERLPGEIEALLTVPAKRFRAAFERFERDVPEDTAISSADIDSVATEYEHAAMWLKAYASDYDVLDHADRFLVDHVLLGLAGDLAVTGRALREAAIEGASLPRDQLRHLLARLRWIFDVRITSFQRKRYVSLSDAPNKAMNLNSYIGLMGGRYREAQVREGGRALLLTDGDADLVVRDPDYVLTLDADSLLLPEYCLRLVYLLEQAEHARVAVTQTPYSSFPGAATRLERMAGATTDLQHIVHQGMTHYNATFWVGANAVLRKRALDDLRTISHHGDWVISRYISDRTVIEDTESSVDLGVHGWRLLNYPERLSYSATPPDFGALCIQRKRWANGGLLILPRLWRQRRERRERGERQQLGETLLRINYMASIAWSSIALIFLLLFQFNDRLISPLVLLVTIPYFAMMAIDLRHCGYRARDVYGMYGFNLVLLAVNLAGVGASLLQLLIGGKPAFRRTPKVRTRTTPSLSFIVLPYVFVLFAALTFKVNLDHGHWVNLTIAAINGILAAYAIVAYIGVGNTIVDVWHNVVSWLYKPQRPAGQRRLPRAPAPALATASAAHWSETLAYAPPHASEVGLRGSMPGGFPGDRRSPDSASAVSLGRRRDDPPRSAEIATWAPQSNGHDRP